MRKIARVVSLPNILVAVIIWATSSPALATSHCEMHSDWKVGSQECPFKRDWSPSDKKLNEILDRHQIWVADKWNSEHSGTPPATFCNVKRMSADFSGKDLTGADFRGANLSTYTDPSLVNRFDETNLSLANFQDAELSSAYFRDAKLWWTNFENADLWAAQFKSAVFYRTNLKGAKLLYADLTDSTYLPSSPPSKYHLSGISGLKTLDLFNPVGDGVEPSAAVQLRELLREVGLRFQEREITYAIEHNLALQLRQSCPPTAWLRDSVGNFSLFTCNPIDWIHGVARLLLFEFTTEWGYAPGRALLMLVILIFVMTPVYMVAILIGNNAILRSHGLFRIWPQDRLEITAVGVSATRNIRVERLSSRLPLALAWAVYFSLISSFHIGWRDLNVGNWISRMQFREYYLRPLGWVRCVSGTQSLISVYLIAICILTYFGRPFQ